MRWIKIKFMSAIVISAMIFCMCGCSKTTSDINDDEKSTTDYTADDESWYTYHKDLYHKNEKVYTVTDINENSDNYIDVSYVDDNNVYISYFSETENNIVLRYSNDGGDTWQATEFDYSEYSENGGIGEVYVSFADTDNGYLLYCSDAAAGMMDKILFGTADGGKTIRYICNLTDGILNYPTEMSFYDDATGIILTQNHGSDDYAYITYDSGLTWSAYTVDIEDGDSYNYIDGKSLVKSNDGSWLLTLSGATDDGFTTLSFVSDDWQSWE